MVFTSQIFLFYFLPLVLLAYYALPRRGRNVLLTLVSYVFYGWWNPWFVLLMFSSTVVDWYCGIAISKEGASEKARKRGVLISIVSNLSLLGFFKYFGFAQENLNRLLVLFGAEATGVLEVILPVGISFYSLQSMSYSIDLYRGDAKRAKNFGDFACYVAMFPQLVAGPIVRYHEIYKQLDDRPQRGQLFRQGVLCFMIGFAKKILLANTLGEIADLTFGAGSMPAEAAWFGVLAYSFQIYFDFSGYSDMAIGLGNMLGFQLPINFKSPYRADSITDFWRRWHVSLSSWLRDYLYIPLGGNRGGTVRTYINLMLTMLLGGLWHGAQWTFLVWGLFHGVALAAERAAGKRAYWSALPRPIRVFVTMILVLLSWVPFRATSLDQLGTYLSSLFVGCGDALAGEVLAGRVFQPYYLVIMTVGALVIWAGTATDKLVERALKHELLSLGIFALFLLSVVAMSLQAENPFLYFQF